MGYSPPKCTCHGKQSHSSKYMTLLECLHAQSHVSSPHRLPHTCLSQMRVKYSFQNKSFLFSKTYYRVLVKFIGQPSEANLLDNPLKQFMGLSEMNCWTISQHNSPENLLSKFISQTFSFLFSFKSCTHTKYSRVPHCIWNALANIFFMCILT